MSLSFVSQSSGAKENYRKTSHSVYDLKHHLIRQRFIEMYPHPGGMRSRHHSLPQPGEGVFLSRGGVVGEPKADVGPLGDPVEFRSGNG